MRESVVGEKTGRGRLLVMTGGYGKNYWIFSLVCSESKWNGYVMV